MVYFSNHPGIQRLSKQYPVNVSYPKTRLANSRLFRRIQPYISSPRNEVQAHLRSTLQSSVTVSDLTPHAYSIQRLISTMQALSIHIWSHSRHASEPWIPTLHYLWICPCQQTECHLVQHTTFRCRRSSSRSNPAQYLNLCLIGMWRLPLNCHNCHPPCQPILWRKVSTTRLP